MHSTDNLNDGYLGSGKHLWRSINKYGKENHNKEIMEFLSNRSSLKEREKELVNEELVYDKSCMNLSIGGEGGIHNEEHAIKLHKAASDWLKKQWADPIFREKNKQNLIKYTKINHKLNKYKFNGRFLGKHHTEEFKIKLGLINSTKQKGNGNSQYGTCWITNNKKNKKIKKEEIQDYLNQGWVKGRNMG
jgi:hypothetical protein